MSKIEKQIQALVNERAGYVLRKLPARIAEVDKVLRLLGVKPEVETATAQPVIERAAKPAVAKRSAGKQ